MVNTVSVMTTITILVMTKANDYDHDIARTLRRTICSCVMERMLEPQHASRRRVAVAGRARSSAENMSRPGSTHTRSPVAAVPEESEEVTVARDPTPLQPASIFIQAVDWLLDVKAMPVGARSSSSRDYVKTY